MKSTSNKEFNLAHPAESRDVSQENAGGKSILEIPKYFKHITFNTGHISNDYWSVENNEVSMGVCDFITRALISEGLTVVRLQKKDWPLRLTVDGANLMAEIYLPQDRPKNNPPAISFGVAVDASRGEKLWQALHHRAGQYALKAGVPKHFLCLAGDANAPPEEPWIAAVLAADIERVVKEPDWLESFLQLSLLAAPFESNLAWGFVEWVRKQPQS